ncbi:hypothetical protein ES703_55172 [subsurface metagenome]
MKTTAKIAAALLVLTLAGSVSARVITVKVEGVVNYFNTQGGFALDGSVGLGSVMTGSCSYDTQTPDLGMGSGSYAMISISMTIGNYTFMHDPMSVDPPLFRVSTVDPVYIASSDALRFDGTIYVNNSPKTWDEVDLDTFGLSVLSLGGWNDYGITDALPDSFMDLSVYSYRSFGVVSSPDHIGPGFYIRGELTSLTVIPEPPKTYYVDADDGNDNNDGLSLQTPFATIQKAIDSAYDGDTVLVADGNYTGPGNRDIDFLGKAITVRSESGPENCIIDCNGTEADQHRGFYFHNNENHNAVVEGFTITSGYASSGGGIFCGKSSPTIINCIITGNSGDERGGGICCEWEGSPTITGCIISNNSSSNAGGGIFSWQRSSPTISNCTISDNRSMGGGGICCWWESSPTITNSTLSGNSAQHGGAIYCQDSILTIQNCVISGNIAEDGTEFSEFSDGGAILCSGGSSTISSCTITGNSAGHAGGGIASWADDTTVSNCILWANQARQGLELYFGYDSNAWVSYSDIQGGWEDFGNIDADPCFIEPGYWDANDTPDDVNDDFWVEGNYYLLPDSLCIDAGDPDYIPEPNETDLDGNPRVIGDAIDMGAYETNYIQAAMKFTPQMLNCNSKGKYVKAHLTLPEEFLPEDVDVNEPAVAEPMGAYSEHIKVLGAGPVRLEIAFDREAFCAQITETGEVEITVIGSLTTSRYFYATDTIKIKPRH